MEPSENNSPELSLPKPVSGDLEPSTLTPEKAKVPNPIEVSAPRERLLSDLDKKVASINATIASSSTNNQSSANDDSNTPQASGSNNNPLVANDDDLIEKEWVDMAKKIIDATRENPYEQSMELSNMKSDYMRKRYGKEVKISD